MKNKKLPNDNKKKTQDDLSPIGAGVGMSKGLKEDEISTSARESQREYNEHKRSPEWITAFAAVLLVLVTILNFVFTHRQNQLTSDALALEQRAWLGFRNYAIQARVNPASPWQAREPTEGEECRVRFFIHNTGNTPALNVRLMRIKAVLVPRRTVPSEPDTWVDGTSTSTGSVLLPDNDSIGQEIKIRPMSKQEFSDYASFRTEVFFWKRLYYCDVTGRLHWIQAGVSHAYRQDSFAIRSTSLGTEPGGANHPECE